MTLRETVEKAYQTMMEWKLACGAASPEFFRARTRYFELSHVAAEIQAGKRETSRRPERHDDRRTQWIRR